MRRVITVNLAGSAYQLDEDAYERLRAYIALTESRLGASPERVQVLADLERSVADQLVAIRAQTNPQTNDGVVSDATMLQVLTNVGGVQGASSDPFDTHASEANEPLPSRANDRANDGGWEAQESEYTRLPVFVLCGFLGWFGVHRMYVGKIGTGLLQLITIGGLGIWTLYDLILILLASFTDSDGRTIIRWA
jgi:hypothetical protein